MSGTREGGLKARVTNKIRHGDDFYSKIGQVGGRHGRNCAVIATKEVAKHAKPIELHDYLVLSNGVVISRSGFPMKPILDSDGDFCVEFDGLDRGGHPRTEKIAKVVANSFIKNPDNLPYVRHINGDKSDNRVSNLEWVSEYDYSKGKLKLCLKGKLGNLSGYANKVERVKKVGSNVLYAITKGYVSTELFAKYNIDCDVFWHAVKNGDIKVGSSLPDITGVRKRKFYYKDIITNEWRVGRSDCIPVRKVFDNEQSAFEYSTKSICAGGFASNPQLARIAGHKGGKSARRGSSKKGVK